MPLIEDGVNVIHRNDTRYRRQGPGNRFKRTGHAVTASWVAHRHRMPAAPRLPARGQGAWKWDGCHPCGVPRSADSGIHREREMAGPQVTVAAGLFDGVPAGYEAFLPGGTRSRAIRWPIGSYGP